MNDRIQNPVVVKIVLGLASLLIPLGLLAGRPVTKDNFVNNKTLRVWIYLRDTPEFNKYFTPVDYPEKTRQRLAKMGSLAKTPDVDRVPGEELRAIFSANVVKMRHYSRFLKAFSAEIDSKNLIRLRDLPIVDRIEIVRCDVNAVPPDLLRTEERQPAAVGKSQAAGYERQLRQLNILRVHEMGITGAGVRIGVIDTGFFKDHEIFNEIVSTGRLIAEYDFINDDDDVSDEEAIDTTSSGYQSTHGTAVWGLIGGHNPSVYVGAAYGAEFLLAKTERLNTEIRREEDDFVAAVEWCDYWGADIVSVSLGYRNDFKGGFEYSWEELDGQTAITTRAVNWAFERGILFVCCAGNEAGNFIDGGLVTPGDAFGALTVGAVDSLGVIAGFSSCGPTYDGRIKPDLCAMGKSAYLARSNATNSYYYADGTSFSTPLIAGCAALLLESQPDLTPIELVTELKRYANRASNPNNSYGWGIPDMYQSIVNYEPAGFPKTEISAKKILTYPNPTNSSINFYFVWQKATPVTSATSLQIFNIRGQLVYEKKLTVNYLGKKEIVIWNLRNQSGEMAAAGIYFVRLQSPDYLKTGKFLIMH